jgi:hypothetical protein
MGGIRTHWGLGAPQSTHLLFWLDLEISTSLERVSGSTSHIFPLILAVCDGGRERNRWWYVQRGQRAVAEVSRGVEWSG